MSADANIKTIARIYEAFGPGNVACCRGTEDTAQSETLLRA